MNPTAVPALLLEAGIGVAHAIGALLVVYLFGYVAGSLLLGREAPGGLALAVVRTVSGLLLTAVVYLASLALSAPWFIGPLGVLTAAVCLSRRAAFVLPTGAPRWDAWSAASTAVGLVLFAPTLISGNVTISSPPRARLCAQLPRSAGGLAWNLD